MDVKDQVNEIVDELKQLRDELKLQLHLAKEDISEQWETAETKLHHLEDQAAHIASSAKDASGDVVEAAKLLGSELKTAFGKIRKSL
ncbi:MAG: hypothetical protein OEX03_10210 [Gammaproteobacteria bacterium]|nr:hypothetical protein [Gammaproteobacteria bacterium]